VFPNRVSVSASTASSQASMSGDAGARRANTRDARILSRASSARFASPAGHVREHCRAEKSVLGVLRGLQGPNEADLRFFPGFAGRRIRCGVESCRVVY
jgi:hypothetical protein